MSREAREIKRSLKILEKHEKDREALLGHRETMSQRRHNSEILRHNINQRKHTLKSYNPMLAVLEESRPFMYSYHHPVSFPTRLYGGKKKRSKRSKKHSRKSKKHYASMMMM